MTVLNSKIYICNGIKLDKTYKNVINYSEADMLTLCETNKIAYATTYSFIKHGANKILVDFTYSDCLQANYMCFQNYDYNNKWFFAFIDSVEYSSNGATIINYTIDVFATWFNSLTVKRCFVVREHVNSDTLGAHTIPEGLEVGEYIVQSHTKDAYNNSHTIVTGTLITPQEVNLQGTKPRMVIYDGMPSGLIYSRWDTRSDCTTFIQALADEGKNDYLVSMFLAPTWLCPLQTGDAHLIKWDTETVSYVEETFTRISALDGYTPKNKKMLCYPFCYIGLSNGVGQYNIYHQENWALDNSNKMVVRIFGALSGGCSIKAIPVNYLKTEYNIDEGITIGKFPMLAWTNDLYSNWQVQQGLNILGTPVTHSAGAVIGGVLKSATGATTGNYDMAGSGIGSIFSEMTEMYRKSITPIGVQGSLNTADINVAKLDNCLHIYKMTIKNEYAKICDEFLTRFGYKVTTLKEPNITGRKYWNYVQIGGSESIGFGNIPADAMSELNKIFTNGVTIWHNHDNIGNYNLDNIIL